MRQQTVYLKKLSILVDLIDFAKVNGLLECEYDFLQEAATDLGVDTIIYESLFDVEIEKTKPRTQSDCIQHLYTLVQLFKVDHKQSIVALNRLHHIGIAMGLSPVAIQQVLSLMHNYPNKDVPFAVVESTLMAQYN